MNNLNLTNDIGDNSVLPIASVEINNYQRINGIIAYEYIGSPPRLPKLKLDELEVEIYLTTFVNGFYYLKIISKNNTVVRKIVKQ